jgi:hypothetical protein
MRSGLSRLVHPATLVSEIDLDATREQRCRLHEELRLRAHLRWLLDSTTPGDGLVRVTPYEVVDGDGSTEVAS